ncbi:MAG: glycosyltransferase family 4 protein [Acidobacteria bacterium]|nr:glycosyltransferase family 4 protein [Acidobacteriota bacterium]
MPDPASVGQHLAGAAESMATHGWDVRVVTSNAGYDDPRQRYPAREVRNGVEVVRLPFTSFGKGSLALRLAGQLSFVMQAVVRSVLGARPTLLLVSTSPPFAGIIALTVAWLRRSEIAFWAMDINPEQAVAAGAFRERSLPVRLMGWMNSLLLARAKRVVALDRLMAGTLLTKRRDLASRMRIVPPWPLEQHLESVDHAHNPFRVEHGLNGRLVVMYSGNHSPVHPLDTLLEAARQLQSEPLLFAFIGGGQGKAAVEQYVREHKLENVLCLPYQPLERLRFSLSAADVHVVSMGEAMVGLVHPCKVYGAMALGRPVLLVGPQDSHVGDLVIGARCGWQVDHGDVEAVVALLRRLLRTSPGELEAMGARGLAVVRAQFGEERLRADLVEVLEECVKVDVAGGPAGDEVQTLAAAG